MEMLRGGNEIRALEACGTGFSKFPDCRLRSPSLDTAKRVFDAWPLTQNKCASSKAG